MRSQIYENWLSSNGWEWEYFDNIKVSSLPVVTRDALEQIRVGAAGIDMDVVNQLVLALKGGAQWEPLVLARQDDGTLAWVNGIHRYSAYREASVKTCDIYVIYNAKTDALLRVARGTANLPVKEVNHEERLILAIGFYNSGYSEQESARLALLPISVVQRAVKQDATRKELAEQFPSLHGAADVPKNTLDALGRIKRVDMRQAVSRVAILGRLQASEVQTLSMSARKVTTDEESIKFRKKLDARWGDASKQPEKPTKARVHDAPVVRMNRAMQRERDTQEYWEARVDPTRLDATSKKEAEVFARERSEWWASTAERFQKPRPSGSAGVSAKAARARR